MITSLRSAARNFLDLLWSRSAYRFVMREWQTLPDIDTAAQVINTIRFSRNLKPVTLDVPQGRKICVLAPHIDDEAIGPGGTLIKAAKAGKALDIVFLTTAKPGETEAERKRRTDEAQDAANRIGARSHLLGYDIGHLPASGDAARRLGMLLGDLRPDTLFLPFLLDDHAEHRRVSELLLTMRAEGFAPSQAEVWAYQVYTAVLGNVIVDITQVADAKREMIQCYRSQMRKRDWAHFALGLNAWNSRFAAGSAEPRFVEMFMVLPILDYLDLCSRYFRPTGDTPASSH